MITKVYMAVWAIFGLAAMALFATGTLTGFTLVGMGMAAFGIIFMGMMFVLPVTMAHPELEAVVAIPQAMPQQQLNPVAAGNPFAQAKLHLR